MQGNVCVCVYACTQIQISSKTDGSRLVSSHKWRMICNSTSVSAQWHRRLTYYRELQSSKTDKAKYHTAWECIRVKLKYLKGEGMANTHPTMPAAGSSGRGDREGRGAGPVLAVFRVPGPLFCSWGFSVLFFTSHVLCIHFCLPSYLAVVKILI